MSAPKNMVPPAPKEEPKRRTRVLTLDRALLAGAFIVLAATLALMFFGDILQTEKQEGAAVGRLEGNSGDVRRRTRNGVAWMQVAKGDGIYEGDSVFTGDASTAEISLIKGSKLSIEAKSLVVIRTSSDELELDLRYGGLHGKIESDKKVVLKVNGQRQELSSQGAQVRIVRAERDSAAKLEVLSGEVKVKQGKETKTVHRDETAAVDAARGEVRAAKSTSVKLLDPAASAEIWSAPGAPLRFQWRSSDPAAKLVIEVAKDPAFRETVVSVPIKVKDGAGASEISIKNLPAKGELRWRLRAADDSLIVESETRRFAIWPDVAPTLQEPKDGQSFDIPPNAAKPVAMGSFSWTDASNSKSYQVQVAGADGDFTHPKIEREVNSMSLNDVELASGDYAWRVRGSNPARKDSPWSQARKVSAAAPKPLAPPTLKNPTLSFVIPRASMQEGATDAKGDGLQAMQWSTGGAGADHYALERSDNPRFDHAVKADVKGDNYRLERLSAGPVYWRVRSVAADGRQSEPSAPGQWSIYAPAPVGKDTAPVQQSFDDADALKKGQTQMSLAWDPAPWASSYEVQVGSDPSFSKSKSFKTNERAKALTISQPGDYSWRVRSLDDDGKALSQWSEARKALYEKKLRERKVAAIPPPPPPPPPTQPESGIPAPTLTSPAPATSMVALSGSQTFANFIWTQVPGATGYKLQIASEPSFASTVQNVQTKRASFFMKSDLPPGALYWRVQAVVGNQTSSWSKPNQFSVIAK